MKIQLEVHQATEGHNLRIDTLVYCCLLKYTQQSHLFFMSHQCSIRMLSVDLKLIASEAHSQSTNPPMKSPSQPTNGTMTCLFFLYVSGKSFLSAFSFLIAQRCIWTHAIPINSTVAQLRVTNSTPVHAISSKK